MSKVSDTSSGRVLDPMMAFGGALVGIAVALGG
jgi:hypothetical protein